jgi:hypothetical protein
MTLTSPTTSITAEFDALLARCPRFPDTDPAGEYPQYHYTAGHCGRLAFVALVGVDMRAVAALLRTPPRLLHDALTRYVWCEVPPRADLYALLGIPVAADPPGAPEDTAANKWTVLRRSYPTSYGGSPTNAWLARLPAPPDTHAELPPVAMWGLGSSLLSHGITTHPLLTSLRLAVCCAYSARCAIWTVLDILHEVVTVSRTVTRPCFEEVDCGGARAANPLYLVNMKFMGLILTTPSPLERFNNAMLAAGYNAYTHHEVARRVSVLWPRDTARQLQVREHSPDYVLWNREFDEDGVRVIVRPSGPPEMPF